MTARRYTLSEIQTMTHTEIQEALVAIDSELAQLHKELEDFKALCNKQGWELNDAKS